MAFWFWFMTSVFRWRNPIISEVCVMVEPCLATKPHTATHALPCLVGLGERIQRVKARKLDGWDKDGFIGKAKVEHASKAKQGVRSLLPMCRQEFSHPQEIRDSLCAVVTWQDKCRHCKQFSSHVTIWSWISRLWGGVSCRGWVPPLLVHP